jgi:preprotein translocase subunit SecF
MKLNKKSLAELFSFNFIANAKFYIAAVGVLLLSAIIIVSVIGLKLGFDFKGGTVIEVVYDVDVEGETYTENDVKIGVVNVLNEITGLEVDSYQTAEGAFGDKCVFKLISNNRLSDGDVLLLKAKIYTELDDYSQEHIIQSQYVSVYTVSATEVDAAIYASIALSVALVIFALGVLIRYGLSQAITSLIVCLINVFLVFSYVIITRTAVNVAFISSVLTIFALTMIGIIMYLDRLREINKNRLNKDLTRADRANLAVKGSFSIVSITFSIALICVILLTGFGVAVIRGYGVPVIFGIIVSALSTFYLMPFFYNLIDVNMQQKRKSKR